MIKMNIWKVSRKGDCCVCEDTGKNRKRGLWIHQHGSFLNRTHVFIIFIIHYLTHILFRFQKLASTEIHKSFCFF